MKKILLPLFVVSVIAVSFITGMAYGFKLGIYNFGMLSTIVNGSLSSRRLSMLQMEEKKKENLEFIKFYFELEVDEAIYAYKEFEDKGNILLSNHFLTELYDGKEEYIQTLAEYRTTHPILYNPDPEYYQPDQEFHKNRVERIKTTLREHGVPESALSTYATKYFK